MSETEADMAREETVLHEHGASLIRDAFALAKSGGSDDWDRMTTAVLKNRILDLTKRSFDEANWGARSFKDFIEQFTDVVEIDSSVRPAQVVLRDTSSVTEPELSLDDPRKRVRQDLWDAFFNRDAAGRYTWVDGRANLTSGVGDQSGGEPVLPTVRQEQLDEWRKIFAEESAAQGLSEGLRTLLATWQTERGPDWRLPRFMRGRWNAALKGHVFHELTKWFDETGSARPTDLIVIQPSQARNERASTDETNQLRAVVIELVNVMTWEELCELRLPAPVLLRMKR